MTSGELGLSTTARASGGGMGQRIGEAEEWCLVWKVGMALSCSFDWLQERDRTGKGYAIFELNLVRDTGAMKYGLVVYASER